MPGKMARRADRRRASSVSGPVSAKAKAAKRKNAVVRITCVITQIYNLVSAIVFGGYAAEALPYFVQPGYRLGVERAFFGGSQVLIQLLQFRCAQDDAFDCCVMEQPAEGQAYHRAAGFLSDGADGFDGAEIVLVPVAVEIHFVLVEAGAADRLGDTVFAG